MLDTAIDHKSINHGYDMRHPIPGIKHRARVADIRAHPRARHQSQHRLHTNIQPLGVKGLEHDLRHMLPVFRRVEGRFCQHKDAFLGITAQVVEDAPVPEFLHIVPSLDHAALDGVYFGGSWLLAGNVADFEVEGLWDFFVAKHQLLFAYVLGLCDEGGDVEGGLDVACVAHLCVACAVVDYDVFCVHG